MNQIFIKDLRIKASIGVYAKEKKRKQHIILNMTGTLDQSCQGHLSDNVDDTVSYEVFVNEAKKLAASKHFELVEHYAEKLAQNILKQARLSDITIDIEKPEIIKECRSVGVKIRRAR